VFARDLAGKERRPESKVIVPMALGKSVIEDVPRRGSGNTFGEDTARRGERLYLPSSRQLCLLSKPNQETEDAVLLRVAQAPQPIRMMKN